MSRSRTIILGGGLSGLAAAYFSGAPLYEAASRCGGVASSDVTDRFAFDRGIHVLQTRNAAVLDLLKEVGVEMRDHSRKAYIHSHDVYTAYPFQVNTAGLPIGVRFRCLWGFLNRQKESAPTNYKEWMYRALGPGFADTFLIPYSEKFWGVHPREMTFEWTGNRVPKPSLWQVVRGALWSKQTRLGTNADFRYPVSGVGYGEIADALARRVNGIHLEHRAEHIDTVKQRVFFGNGNEIGYDTLISTIPLPEVVRIASHAPREVREAAARLRTNSIMVVNLGIDRPPISNSHWVHFPEKDISFFRISFPHNFADSVAPHGMSSISAEVSYSRDDRPDPEVLMRRVVDDLIRVGALKGGDPIVMQTTYDIPYAYCIFDKRRKPDVKKIHEWLDGVGVIPCGRYGQWAYLWSDEAILSGKRAAEKLSASLKKA